jgi:cytochrome c peroxidase
VGRFKTPGLRDLNHSTPFMHNGAFDDLRGAVRFYQRASELARASALRNGDRRMPGIRLSDDDVESLVRFLAALNEDYS